MKTEASGYIIEDPKPLILIISGLSGAGKDTVINRLKEISPVDFHFVVTCNTRKKREGEIDGKDYHFITREKFLDMIKKGVDPKEAFEKNIGTYGRFADAAKTIDPRKE